jgi:catechol 2,3-dioxygenase-like lactoylglutathione lyase family enzyme
MTLVSLNHVSLCARDVEESAAFFVELLGADELPHHNAGVQVRWLRVGEQQLHLIGVPDWEPPRYQHVGFAVADFPRVYDFVMERGAEETDTFGHHLLELPSGQIQLFLKDPTGNLIEINASSKADIGDRAAADLRRLEDRFEQTDFNRQARLFLPTS